MTCLGRLQTGVTREHYATRPAPFAYFWGKRLTAALIVYRWTSEEHTACIAPVSSNTLVAFAGVVSYMPVQLYVVNVDTLHTASATGAMSTIRSAIFAVVPFRRNRYTCALRASGTGGAIHCWQAWALSFIALGVVVVK